LLANMNYSDAISTDYDWMRWHRNFIKSIL